MVETLGGLENNKNDTKQFLFSPSIKFSDALLMGIRV